jgi:hypothetical protein
MKERNSVGSSDGLPARHVDAFLDRLGIPGHRDRRFRMNVTGHSGSS